MSEPVFNSDGRCLCGHVSMVEQGPAFVQLSRDSPSRLRPQGEVVWIPGLGPVLGYLESHRGRRRIIASTQVSIKGKHHGKPTDVWLDPKRRRFGEMAREKGVPISDEMRRLIDDACESILNERRRHAIEQLISLGWRRPMIPAQTPTSTACLGSPAWTPS